MQNIPPPPPGFVLEGSGAPPPAPRPAAPAPAQGQRQPRGIRNNNPGNIEDGAFARSLPGYAGSDGRFAIFNDPQAGVQAKTRLLGSYLQRGFDTPGEIINRWAPPSDNNPTDRYASYVANRVGVGVDDPVTADQIPLLAQAIGEFENGQQQPVEQARMPPPPPGFEMDNGDPTSAPQALGSQGNPIDLTNLRYQDEYAALKKGAFVRDSYGRTYALPSDAWTGTPDDSSVRQASNVYQDYQTPGDTAMAGMTAFTEQIPFADEAIAGAAGAISGRGYGQVRDQMMQDRQYFNDTQGAARDVGGLAGFAAGLAAPGGAFIARGPSALYRASRAGAVGAGLGAVYGAGNSEGGLQERLASGGRGAAIGAVSGGLLQGAGDRLMQSARAAQPSAARVLSREGVDLTPGQMMSGVPMAGPIIRGLEEGASSIPIVGAPIAAARERSVETFNRAAINRSLSPIGERLPRGVNAGYGAVEQAQEALGRAYDEVLPRVQAQLDQPLYDQLSEILNRAASEMPEDMTRQLGAVLQNRVFRGVEEANGVIEGSQFKRIESELGALSRNYRTANDPAARSFGQAVDDVRGAMRDLIARQNPEAAQRISDINRGYANLVRVEQAAGSTASQAAEGVFSPTQLGMAVNRGATRSSRSTNNALMQDLAVAGRAVLSSRVGDSGTATHGALTGLVAGAGSAINPGVAIPTAVGAAVAYSRPVQTLLNTIYRATDRPGASAEALSRLATLARSDPALVPVYEAALRHSMLAAPSQGQERTPRRAGLFGTTRPQMAPQ